MMRGLKDIFGNQDGLLRVRLGVLAYLFATAVLATWFFSWLSRAPIRPVVSAFDLMVFTLVTTIVLFNPRVKIWKPKRK